MQLVSKISNLCGPESWSTNVTDGRTDGRTTCNLTSASRGKTGYTAIFRLFPTTVAVPRRLSLAENVDYTMLTIHYCRPWIPLGASVFRAPYF